MKRNLVVVAVVVATTDLHHVHLQDIVLGLDRLNLHRHVYQVHLITRRATSIIGGHDLLLLLLLRAVLLLQDVHHHPMRRRIAAVVEIAHHHDQNNARIRVMEIILPVNHLLENPRLQQRQRIREESERCGL